MPSVASETPALKPAAPPPPRPVSAPAGDSAPVAPFESLLDAGSQPVAADPPPSPPPTGNDKAQAAPPKPSEPQGQQVQNDSGKAAKTDDQAKPAGKPDTTDQAAGDAKSTDSKAGGDSKKTDAKTGTDEKAATNSAATPAAASAAPADRNPEAPPADQNAAASKAADTQIGGDGKTKTDVISATQAAAEDGLKTPVKDAKDNKDTKGKSSDSKKSADGGAATGPDASQALATNGTNAAATAVAVVTPAATPATPSPAKAPAKDAAIDVDSPPKGKQAAAAHALLQADTGKPSDEAKSTDAKPAEMSTTNSDGKPQAVAADSGKPADAPAPGTQAANVHHAADAPTQAAPNTASHAATTKAADAAPPPPPVIAPAPTSAPAPAPPAPQLQPQAAAVPLSGVAIDIAGKALAGKNRFEIRLDPPDLGRIEIRLDVDKDGRVTSHVMADNKHTLSLLQRDASSLQRAFQDAGLKTADNGLQFSLRDQSMGQQQQQQNPGNTGANTTNAQIVVDDGSLTPINATSSGYSRLVGLNGGLDIRV